MTDGLTDSPLWLAVGALSLIGLLRGQLTYWIARFVGDRAGRALADEKRGERSARFAARFDRGRVIIRRWGVVAVPLCYLTVGLQTVVLGAAGLSGMPWLRFTLAQLPGALAWGTIYATVGWAAWTAAVSGAAGQPVVRLLIALVVLVGIGIGVGRLMRRRAGVG